MTREEALEFRARWVLVSEAMREEIRRTPLDAKLRQLASIFLIRGRSHAELDEIESVRSCWVRLKAASRG